jgi:hypothetical protein
VFRKQTKLHLFVCFEGYEKELPAWSMRVRVPLTVPRMSRPSVSARTVMASSSSLRRRPSFRFWSITSSRTGTQVTRLPRAVPATASLDKPSSFDQICISPTSSSEFFKPSQVAPDRLYLWALGKSGSERTAGLTKLLVYGTEPGQWRDFYLRALRKSV